MRFPCISSLGVSIYACMNDCINEYVSVFYNEWNDLKYGGEFGIMNYLLRLISRVKALVDDY